LGFTPSGRTVCRWVSNSVRTFRVEGQQPLSNAIDVAKPHVSPKKRSTDLSAKAAG
jgi:hypothetical protein